jgi:hypothetical protein
MRASTAILVFAFTVGSVAGVHARARYKSKAEMIQTAEVIAVVEVTSVSTANTIGKHWTYQQKATATVERVLKGELPSAPALYGDEDFICAQCRFAVGRHLFFLRCDGDLWVGANWYLSVRPITDETIEWHAKDKGTELKPFPLKDVLEEIERIMTPDAKIIGLSATVPVSGDSRITSTNDAHGKKMGPAQRVGIGAAVGFDSLGNVRVTTVFRDSPACKAGLERNDTITEIDSNPTNGFDFEKLGLAMRGEVGSLLHLTISREGQTDAIHIEVKRAVIRFGKEEPCE